MADEVNDFGILSYQFEPLVNDAVSDDEYDADETDSNSGESDSEEEVNHDRVGNTDWCLCGECQPMTSGLESMCCQEVDEIQRRAEEEAVVCVTFHTGFIANCLNRDVLEVSLRDFVDADGPLDDNEPIHE